MATISIKEMMMVMKCSESMALMTVLGASWDRMKLAAETWEIRAIMTKRVRSNLDMLINNSL